MTTENFRQVEERAVEAARIAKQERERAYREGFEEGRERAATMHDVAVWIEAKEDLLK